MSEEAELAGFPAPSSVPEWVSGWHALTRASRAAEIALSHWYVVPKGRPLPATMTSAAPASAMAAADAVRDHAEVAALYEQLIEARRLERGRLRDDIRKIAGKVADARRRAAALVGSIDKPRPASRGQGAQAAVASVQTLIEQVHGFIAELKDTQRRAYTKLMEEEGALMADVLAAAHQYDEADAIHAEENIAPPSPVDPRADNLHRAEQAATASPQNTADASAAQGTRAATSVIAANTPALHRSLPVVAPPMPAGPAGSVAAASRAVDDAGAAVAAIDNDLHARGGANGKWPPEDHTIFLAAVSAVLSRRGVADARALDEDACNLLVSTLAVQLPLREPEAIREHLSWFRWYQERTSAKREALGVWKAARAELKAARAAEAAAAKEDDADRDSIADARVRPRSLPAARRRGEIATVAPTTRAAIAAWKSERDAAERARAEREAAAAREAARAADAARATWTARQRAALEEWQRSRAAERDAAASIAGGGLDESARSSDVGAGIRVVPSQRELLARAAAGLDAAASRRAALRKTAEEQEAARIARFGLDAATVSDGTRTRYAYVAHEPARPTTASRASALTPSALAERARHRDSDGAHAHAIPSQRPTARGLSFAIGAAGALPAKAVPAWRARAGVR